MAANIIQWIMHLRHVEEMIDSGADIIDIGAESTRPLWQCQKISAEEELERLAPLLEKVIHIYCTYFSRYI